MNNKFLESLEWGEWGQSIGSYAMEERRSKEKHKCWIWKDGPFEEEGYLLERRSETPNTCENFVVFSVPRPNDTAYWVPALEHLVRGGLYSCYRFTEKDLCDWVAELAEIETDEARSTLDFWNTVLLSALRRSGNTQESGVSGGEPVA